eukprot:1741923-Prymnesium_polylepis.1
MRDVTEHLGVTSPEMISSGQGSSVRRAAERASERRRQAPTAMRMVPSQRNTGSEQPEPGPSAMQVEKRLNRSNGAKGGAPRLQ